MSVLTEALRLHAAGHGVLPIKLDGTKSPDLPTWKDCKTWQPSEYMLRHWFAGDFRGLAVIGGAVSGNLEVLDFDNHRDCLGDTWQRWCAVVRFAVPGLLERLVIYQTPRQGWRVCYRCDVVHQGKGLALARKSEKDTIIELLASGAIILAPGGHPDAHELRKPYVYVQGHLAEVPLITEKERLVIHNAARVFDTWEPPTKKKSRKKKEKKAAAAVGGGLLPGADFNQRGTWEEVLEPADWTPRLGGWMRPGKCGGSISATTDFHQGMLHVFTWGKAFTLAGVPDEGTCVFLPQADYRVL